MAVGRARQLVQTVLAAFARRTAVDSSMLGNATVLDAEVLPFVDGVTATTVVSPAPPADAPIFTFSASQDPGEP
jgi:hypothetical protein